jgi:hypothetical protein
MLYFDALNPAGTIAATSWRSLGNLGNPLGPPTAIRYAGATELFAVDTVTNHLLHCEIANAFTVGPWEDLGGSLVVDKPALVVSQNQVNVFAKTTAGIPQILIGHGGNGTYGQGSNAWHPLGGSIVGEPGAVSWGGQRLDVFVVSAGNGQLYHRYSNDNGLHFGPSPSGNGQPFDGWDAVGMPSGGPLQTTPSVVAYMPNRLDVFATALDGSVSHVLWNGQMWGYCLASVETGAPCWDQVAGGVAWHDLEHGYSAPVAIATGALSTAAIFGGVGDIDVFVQGTDRGLYVTNYKAGATPVWNAWTQLATCFRTAGAPVVSSNDGSTLQIAVTDYASSGTGSLWFQQTATDFSFPGAGTSSPPACACGNAGQACCNMDACGGWSYCGDDEICKPCGSGNQIECPWTSANTPQCQSGLVVNGNMCQLSNGSVTCESGHSDGLTLSGVKDGKPFRIYCCPDGNPPRDGCVPDVNRSVSEPAWICTCTGQSVTETGLLSYYELGITYTPPGNLSNVQYQNGTTIGSHVQVQESSAAGVAVQIGGPVVQLNASFMMGGVDGTSVQVTTSGSWGPGVSSVSDVADHSRDVVWLWLNPSFVATTQDGAMSATVGLPPGEAMDVEPFTMGELMGLVEIPPYRNAKLARLSSDQLASIINTDPFTVGGGLNDAPGLDPNRFLLLYTNWIVRGPDHPGDPPTSFNFNTNNSIVNGIISGSLLKFDATLLVGAKVAFITEGSALAGVTMEYNYQKTTEWDQGTISNANVLLSSSTPCWHQTVDLYWDSMFGTFFFSPVTAGTNSCDVGQIHHGGVVIDSSGAPVVGHVVTATVGGKSWSTATNVRGEYVFYGLPEGAEPTISGRAGELIVPRTNFAR